MALIIFKKKKAEERNEGIRALLIDKKTKRRNFVLKQKMSISVSFEKERGDGLNRAGAAESGKRAVKNKEERQR